MADGGSHQNTGSVAPHWSYQGDTGAAHWGELSASFKTCQLGLEQSPIDLTEAIAARPGGLEIAYQPTRLHVVNNGHTIQANTSTGPVCVIGGQRFALQQFHFHHPSEHLLSGKPFDLECHLVHRSETGDLAVIGVFLRPGQANRCLEPIWNAMPKQEGPERDVSGAVDLTPLLPDDRNFFRYMGSLTTPPCTQGIIWTVMVQPIEASPEQIRQFADLFPDNARPVQLRNRRFLLQSS